MATKFLNGIDLFQTELKAARIQNLSSAPSSPVTGQIFFNTTTGRPNIWNGSAWEALDNDSASELLEKLVTVDGSGSGLDADLLDGQSGSYFLDRANHTGTQTASTISDFDSAVRANRIDQLAMADANVNIDGNKIINLGSPSDGTDAVNKDYVDDLVNSQIAGGLKYRGTVDANDADVDTATGTSTHVNGDMYKVTGAGNTAFGFQLNVGDFVVYNGATWDKIDATDPGVTGTTNRITVTPTGDTSYQVDIASGYAGQSTITTVGTITSGTWNGTTIAVANGGTGATSASGARTNLGLGSIATQDANNVSISGGAITGITDLAVADGGTGASTASDARTNLGLGSIATQDSTAVSISGGDITGITDLAIADGGTGASTASGARTNLGLGTIAVQNANNVTITGGSVSGITDLAVADGGTGASTAVAARANLGAVGKYSALIGDNSATSITIDQATHGLAADGTNTVSVYDSSSGEKVEPGITVDPASGDVTIDFASAPAVDAYLVVIVG